MAWGTYLTYRLVLSILSWSIFKTNLTNQDVLLVSPDFWLYVLVQLEPETLAGAEEWLFPSQGTERFCSQYVPTTSDRVSVFKMCVLVTVDTALSITKKCLSHLNTPLLQCA